MPEPGAAAPSQAGKPTPIVEMRHIEKSFGAVRALRDVNLALNPGEVVRIDPEIIQLLDDRRALIRVIDTGEETPYSLDKILVDPTE